MCPSAYSGNRITDHILMEVGFLCFHNLLPSRTFFPLPSTGPCLACMRACVHAVQAVATARDVLTLPSSAPFIALCLPALSRAACAAPSLASPVIQLIHSALRISKPLLPHSRPRCGQVYQSASAALNTVASRLSCLHSA